jgi:hypothetical protein
MSTSTRPPETNSGVVTSWLPISTAWPSVSQCSTEIYSQLGGGGVAIGFDPYFGMYISSQTTCLPPVATEWWNQEKQTPAQTVTSLGGGPSICPQLYTTAHTSILNSMSTFVACCPSQYAFQSVVGPGALGQCNSPLLSGQEFTYQGAVSGTWAQTTTLITATGVSVFGVHLNGYVLATTSSSAPATTSMSATTSATTSLSTSTTSASSSAASSTNAAASSGLSSGVKAGIGVGVAVGAIGIMSLIAAWFLIRRHRRKADYTAEVPGDAGPLPLKSSIVEGGYQSVAPTELQGGYHGENRGQAVELSGESI